LSIKRTAYGQGFCFELKTALGAPLGSNPGLRTGTGLSTQVKGELVPKLVDLLGKK